MKPVIKTEQGVNEKESQIIRKNFFIFFLYPKSKYKQSKESDYSCLTCGHYGPYRLFKAGDCPDGCTISPVVIYGEILG